MHYDVQQLIIIRLILPKMNFFNSSKKSNANENQDTPFFNKVNHSIFDEQLYRAEEDRAFNFFKASNIKQKPSILSQLQAADIQGHHFEESQIKMEAKRKEEKSNKKISHYREPFSFEPELNSVNMDINKGQNGKKMNDSKVRMLPPKPKDSKHKQQKWKSSNILPLEMSSEPINFQQQDKKHFLFKRNEKLQANQMDKNLKVNAFLGNGNQVPKKTEDNKKCIQLQAKQPAFFMKKIQQRPVQQKSVINETKRPDQKPKPLLKENFVEQHNNCEISSQISNEAELTSNLNVSSEFFHLKSRIDKKPALFLSKPRFGRMLSPDQSIEATPKNYQAKPLKLQNSAQKKAFVPINAEKTKNNQKVVQIPKETKQVRQGEENNNCSAKKMSFLNHVKLTPSKPSKFTLWQPNLSENDQKSSNINQPLNSHNSSQNLKLDRKEEKNIIGKGIQITFSTNQIKKINNQEKQLSIQGQQVVKKQGLKQQLRKFGSRPTQKNPPNFFVQRLKMKQSNNKQLAKQGSILKNLPATPKQMLPKQELPLKQTFNKQKVFIKQIQSKQSKSKQSSELTNAEAKNQNCTPKLQNLIRTESLFVRSMMLVLQMSGESEKLRQMIVSKTQMFNELSFLEKRCSNRIHALLGQNKQK